MEHAGDLEVVALVAEEDPVILRTKPEQGRLHIPKLFGVALTCLDVARPF